MFEFLLTPFIALTLFVTSILGINQTEPEELIVGATVLQVYQGGTGASTFDAGECLVGAGTGAITTQACGGSGGSAAWEKYTGLASPLSIITPTTSGASIYVSGHATVTQALTVNEDLTVDGTTKMSGDLTLDNSYLQMGIGYAIVFGSGDATEMDIEHLGADQIAFYGLDGVRAIFDKGNIHTSDRTFTFPDLSGTFALSSYSTGFTSGHVPFGVSGLLATSSAMIFDSTLNKLTITNASTTADLTVGSNLTVGGNATTTGAQNADYYTGNGQELTLARIGGSTYSTVQHLQDIFHSAGWVSGGAITDAGGGNINVAAGTGLIRATNSATAQIAYFDWSASSTIDMANTTNYIGVEYNGGSPRVAVRSSYDWDFRTDFPLLSTTAVVRE